ncbi:hypothetical protein NBRC116188_09960 [Oceaniserpentilla sp. 4NH20-0058]
MRLAAKRGYGVQPREKETVLALIYQHTTILIIQQEPITHMRNKSRAIPKRLTSFAGHTGALQQS